MRDLPKYLRAIALNLTGFLRRLLRLRLRGFTLRGFKRYLGLLRSLLDLPRPVEYTTGLCFVGFPRRLRVRAAFFPAATRFGLLRPDFFLRFAILVFLCFELMEDFLIEEVPAGLIMKILLIN